MATTQCGWCGKEAHMEAVAGLVTGKDLQTDRDYVSGVYLCPGCTNLNLVRQPFNPNLSSSLGIFDRDAANTFGWTPRAAKWIPRYRDTEDFPDVPEHIASAATEATLCFSTGAYRAVGSLARAVVEATAKDKGATGGTLEKRIDALHAAGHIRSHVREQAHEVRHFGNNMAHGDFTEPTTKEEAAEALDLMREILDEVYQSPARLDAVKKRRLAAKAAAKAATDGSA